MTSSNCTTYPVRGFPAEVSWGGAKWFVQKALDLDDASAIRFRSLACDPARPHEMAATMTLAAPLEQLSSSHSTAEWSFEVSERISLVFDTHFFGCTTLFCPPPDNWKFEYVARDQVGI